MRKAIQNTIKIIIPLFLGMALFWYLYRNLDITLITEILRSGINYYWILLSMFIGLLSHIIRAFRWRLQLQALGAEPPIRTLFNAIFGTYAVNLLFPRLGEIWRCGYISKREKLPFTQVLGSVVSDRISDTLSVLVITLGVLLFQVNIFVRFLANYPAIGKHIQQFFESPWLYIALGIMGGLLWWILRQKGENSFLSKLKKIVTNLWEGFITVLKMKHKSAFVLYTLLIWACYFLQFYVCMFAFSFTSQLGILAALTLFVMGSISVALPVQGGIGPWHFAIISILVIYGVGENEAGAFALVVHGAQMLLIILLGIYTLISIYTENKTDVCPIPINPKKEQKTSL